MKTRTLTMTTLTFPSREQERYQSIVRTKRWVSGIEIRRSRLRSRLKAPWWTLEVKICKDPGLTINQSKVINGESYIVVNYKANSLVKSIWVLWIAEDRFFSPRLKNSNARSLNRDAAAGNIEVIFEPKANERN